MKILFKILQFVGQSLELRVLGLESDFDFFFIKAIIRELYGIEDWEGRRVPLRQQISDWVLEPDPEEKFRF